MPRQFPPRPPAGASAGDHRLELTPDYAAVRFSTPRPVLSSAIHNGGLVEAAGALILRVAANHDGAAAGHEPPRATLARSARALGLAPATVGMMTSASLDSLRYVALREGGVRVAALVTAGVSNARRAGDRAEWRTFDPPPPAAGTINILVLTDARLGTAALAEALMVATEAKAAALQSLGVFSPVSGGTATGTGTDATAVAGGHGPAAAEWCGKHTLLGEMIAGAVIAALTDSLGGRV